MDNNNNNTNNKIIKSIINKTSGNKILITAKKTLKDIMKNNLNIKSLRREESRNTLSLEIIEIFPRKRKNIDKDNNNTVNMIKNLYFKLFKNKLLLFI